jgi:hypothetical protein
MPGWHHSHQGSDMIAIFPLKSISAGSFLTGIRMIPRYHAFHTLNSQSIIFLHFHVFTLRHILIIVLCIQILFKAYLRPKIFLSPAFFCFYCSFAHTKHEYFRIVVSFLYLFSLISILSTL